MIRHIVIFKLKDGIAKEDERVEAAIAAMVKLPEFIHEIRYISSGLNISTRPIAYDYGLIVDFENEADLQTYLVHPAHIASVGLWREIADWNIVDYII